MDENTPKPLRWRIAQKLELWWWKNYTRQKSKADYLAWKKNYWISLIEKLGLADELKNANTLADLGCGPFGLALANEDWKKNLLALDPLLDSYEKELPFFAKSDYPHTHFVKQKMEDFVGENKLDMLFCMNAINHVADIQQAFDVLEISLSEKGILVLGIDAHNFSFFKHLFRLIPGDALHPHQYDLAEYQTFLNQRNFTITQTLCIKKEFFFDYYVLVGRNH